MVVTDTTPVKQTGPQASLKQIFEKYCHFGSSRSIAPPSHSPLSGKPIPSQLDGAKFAKLIREAGLIDPNLMTPVDVDIIFSRAKGKGERKIVFGQFLEALRMIGMKKFGGGEEGFDLTCQSILKLHGPSLSPGTTVPHFLHLHLKF